MTGLRRALWALAIAGVFVLVTQIVLLSEADFDHDQGIWIALDIFIGGGFVGVGLFAWYRRPDNRVGTLMTATGFAWFLSIYGLTQPDLLFTAGFVFSNLFIATAIHLLLAFPSGRLPTRLDRWLVGWTYFATTILAIPPMLALDPIAEGCTNCPDNLLLVERSLSFFQTLVRRHQRRFDHHARGRPLPPRRPLASRESSAAAHRHAGLPRRGSAAGRSSSSS